MRQLLPQPADVDPGTTYAADQRAGNGGRPWLVVNMISSLDGATAVDGVSGPLGGPADKEVFGAVRAVADVILVGAGTVAAEGYGPPRPSAARRRERRARGQQPVPRLAVVSRRLELDLDSRLFAPGSERPLVLTTADADPVRRQGVAEVAEVVEVGEREVDVATAVELLGRRGAGVVLAEGGPTLNGQLVAAGLVDELCLTLSPTLVAGDSARVSHGPFAAMAAPMRLDRVLTADDLLFLRYVRAAGDT